MAEFRMPSLGSDMEDGTLIEWEKQPGDRVHRGDVIAVVETQKGAIEIEAFEDGVLERVLVELGDKVPVGTPLAMIGDGDAGSNDSVEAPKRAEEVGKDGGAEPVGSNSHESVVTDAASKQAPEPEPESESISIVREVNGDTTSADVGDRIRVTPAARQLAQASNIGLATLVGSGPQSAIVLDDVRSALASGLQTTPTREKVAAPMDGMRAAIAAAMSRSKHEIPHYYLSHTVQVDKVNAYITDRNSERAPEDRLVMGAVLIKAVALAVKKYPEFNGYYQDGMYTASDAIHVGMAINIRGGGLVAPAIHDADTLSIDESMAKLKDVVARVRKGRFKATELSDPTLTISSLGERGVDSLYGVIYPPQVALVGFGSPVSTVQFDHGKIVPVLTVTITLAADHRVSDGHKGALFLRAIDRNLQEPEKLQ